MSTRIICNSDLEYIDGFRRFQRPKIIRNVISVDWIVGRKADVEQKLENTT